MKKWLTISGLISAAFISRLDASGMYEYVELKELIRPDGPAEKTSISGIPFQVWNAGKADFSLAEAGWPEWEKDSGSYYEKYDGGAEAGDLRMPFVKVPKADYVAAHLLGYAVDDPNTSPGITLRAGRRVGGNGKDSQVLIRDFAGEFPRRKEGDTALHVVRIPFTEAFAQDVEGDEMDIELTKEIRLARRAPDPCRFRWRPLGLPSGVRLAAMTLERSPIQMHVRGSESGNLFGTSATPRFLVTLHNISEKAQDYTLVISSGDFRKSIAGQLPAGGGKEESIELSGMQPGWHPLAITLRSASGEIRRNTAFAVIEDALRAGREDSPFGTSSGLSGIHFTPLDGAKSATLLAKLGLRYVNSKGGDVPYEERQKSGLRQGHEFTVKLHHNRDQIQAYRERLKADPDLLPDLLMFHEEALSARHATRVPDLFVDRPPFKLNAEEEEVFRRMSEVVANTAPLFREKFPEISINLGNGNPALREEFYRQGISEKFFDAAGNESPSFGRPPETQPPDPVGNNSSLWMDRQMLDHYGYSDKKITQSWEVSYPGTNPGNLNLQTHADYTVRHKLHSAAWGVPQIKGGALYDFGNSYQYGNWGQIGLFTSRPHPAPKPAAVAIAAMTLALDGAQYKDFIDTGSESAYLLRFETGDGRKTFPFWVIRGQRNFQIRITPAVKRAAWIDANGARHEIEIRNGQITLNASASPAYLLLPVEADIQSVTLGDPHYPDSEPKGKITPLASLSSLEGWKIETQRNPLLEFYNPMTPRRKGDFTFEPGKNGALQITPRPISGGKPTMPMYAELAAEQEIPLPGMPVEIGLWVDGNSSWGRIIFELEDQSGQQWISIGARARKGGSDWMADWIGQAGAKGYEPGENADWNTDDAWGLSRINFDGWRYLSFPLPGQYPGEGYHWPANSQWKWDKDGIVHYPLKLKKLIVELPEKTLHLTRYAPAGRPEIRIRNLVSVERDNNAPKLESNEYVEQMQINLR